MNNYFERGLVNHRSAYGYHLNRYGLTGTAVEVGVAKGNFAREFLSQWEGQSYWLIDPWEAQDVEVYKETQTNDWNEWYHQCELICKEDKRVQMIKGYSPAAADNFKANSLDSVFLDGNHSYRAVMEDLDAWWPKIRLGGIMAGHDFMTNTEGGAWIEVDKAVERWTKEHNVTFYVCPCTSFFIHKLAP